MFVLLAALCLLSDFCRAFDTGHHHDLIRNALTLKGYDGVGIQIAQESAWLVEYFANVATLNGTTPLARAMHFLDVGSDAKVRVYFFTLANATEFAVSAIVGDAASAVTEYFSLLGITLHTVQNFYAHRCAARAQRPAPHSR